MTDPITPTLLQLGGSGILGFITGYAVKQIMKAVAVIVAVFVMGLGLLASSHSVTINWNTFFANANAASGQVADFAVSTSSVMLQHFQVGGGFLLGFVAAVRK